MSIGSRIKQRREELGLTQPQLAKMIGVSKGSIGNYESEISCPNENILIKLFSALDCDANYLYYDDINKSEEQLNSKERVMIQKYRTLDEYGVELVSSVIDIEYKRCLEANQKKIQHTRLIDFIDIPVSAGIGTYLDDERREQKEIIDSDLADRADFILRIDGDSMEPKYHSGEYVFVKKQDAVDLGQICIYYIDGKGYMKKYGGDRLISLNSKYDDILFSQYNIDEISCFGLVLGLAEVVE